MRGLQQDGIHYRLTQQAALPARKLFQYRQHARMHLDRDDRFLSSWTTPEDEKGSDPWRKLDCPLVVAMPD